MDVVHMIEKAKCNKDDKPYDEIKIMNLTAHEVLVDGA